MTLLCRSILLCALTCLLWLPATAQAAVASPAPASMVVGAIKASNVRGDVRKINLTDKSETPLKNNDTLIQDNAIVTGKGESSVVLVFANGSTVRVGSDSRLEIQEFLMDPLQADVPNVAALTAEPTRSQTNLRLEFGEMVGNVKTLNRAAGSTFSVSTPAGAAGIRGTTFRIVYRPTGNGRAFNFQLSTSEGVVLYEGTTQLGAASVNVPLGQQIQVVAQVDPATNAVTISVPTSGPGGPGGSGGPGGPLGTVPISPEAAAALQSATLQILQTQQQSRFSQVDMDQAQQQKNQAPKPGSNPQGSPPSPLQQSEGQPPPPPSAPPRTTPGDGR